MKICGRCLPKIQEGTYEIRINLTLPKNSPYARSPYSTFEVFEVELCAEHFEELNLTLVGLGIVK